jgi:hypothetical protein
MANNFFQDPIGSAAGAMLAGASGAVQVGTWTASELAKFGRTAGGWPGEVTFALLGAGAGSMTGFFLGSILGGLSGNLMVRYFVGNLQQAMPRAPIISGSASPEIDSDREVERFRSFLLTTGEAPVTR